MVSKTSSECEIEVLCAEAALDLRLERGVVHERLGQPFVMNLSLLCADKEIELSQVVGKSMCVRVGDGIKDRFFHGIVADFAFVGSSEKYGHYQATVRPWLWLLGHSERSRVFSKRALRDVLRDVLSAYGGDDPSLPADPSVTFEHCVQYRESDLAFVSRLMERHGLYYFFEHERGKHHLQVVSGLDGHSSVGSFPYAGSADRAETDQVFDWRAAVAIRPVSYSVTGTRHLTRSRLEEQAKSRFDAVGPVELSVHDFEAVTEVPDPPLPLLARVRQEAADAGVEQFSGSSHSLQLAAGALFTLTGHPRQDQNREYLIVEATYELEGAPVTSGAPSVEQPFVVAFRAIDGRTPFRPALRTRKPVVHGTHTAVVTQEADEHGRVQVRFHWGNPDGDLETCPARVSQHWAGKGWGAVFLPHEGHEVLVEFLDGDPDQPLITGRVYNEESMPPLSLPAEKSQCMIRDHGGNELLMEGADGSQKIRLYCPTHETEIIMGNSITLKSQSDFVNEFVGGWNQAIHGDWNQKVDGGQTRQVGGTAEDRIIGACQIKVGGDVAEVFMGAKHETTLGIASEFFGGLKRESISGAETKKVGGIVYEKLTGAKIQKGNNKEAKDYPDALVKVKAIYKQKASDLVTEVKSSIQQKCENFKIGAKMLTEDVKTLAVKAKDAVVHEAKKARLVAQTAYEVEAKKVKNTAASMLLAAKLTVNDGNFEVKK